MIDRFITNLYSCSQTKYSVWVDHRFMRAREPVNNELAMRIDNMSMIGVCGDNCIFCPRYHATLSGDAKELEKVKDLWVRLGLRESNVPTQNIVCYGCKPENNCAYSEVRACAYGKGVENCGLCNEYPCEKLLVVFEKSEELHTQAVHLCTPEEMDALHKAFCCKRQNLDQVHFYLNDYKD